MPKHNQKPAKQHKIILVTVAVLVLVVGLVAFALFHSGGILNSRVQQPEADTSPPVLQSPVAETPSGISSEGRYLVLEDWGVKFEVPEGLSGVRYYRQNSNIYPELKSVANEWYEFSTARVEALGGKGDNICVEPNDRNLPASRLGGVIRSTEILPIETRPLNGQPIGDYYYYYYGSSQSVCSVDSTDIQQADLSAVHEMIKSISGSR